VNGSTDGFSLQVPKSPTSAVERVVATFPEGTLSGEDPACFPAGTKTMIGTTVSHYKILEKLDEGGPARRRSLHQKENAR
jgi:hypothetical protein